MLDRVVSFLKSLPQPGPRHRGGADDPRIAAIALMFHVIDADGQRSTAERQRLGELVREAYSVGAPDLTALVAAGEEADREAVDLYAFTSVLGRHLDTDARRDLVRALWELAYADGSRHELEDNIVWRVAELIGVDQRERVELRREVEAHIRRGGH